MKFEKLPLPGAMLIEMEPIGDDRGYFVRTFCAREFAQYGLNPQIAQSSFSYNQHKGTLRGLHFQIHPAMEDKLIRCTKGEIFDVIVDIRPGSPQFGKWFGTVLSEKNLRQLFAPAGFAHGFQTLSDDTVVSYQIGQFYEADKTGGVRWDDPQIAVDWPLLPVHQSTRDLELPLLSEISHSQLLGYSR